MTFLPWPSVAQTDSIEPMTITQIQDLIKFVAKSGASGAQLEQKDFTITIKTARTQ